MGNQTPLAPGEPAFDVTVHIVRNDFGHLGRAYIETDEAEADEATIVLSGQYLRPLRVVVFNTAEGWTRDVTEDIACAVLDRAGREHSPIGQAAQEFLERALGVDETLGD
jgi:hypothetical protein